MCVPDVQVRHPGEGPHRLSISGHRGRDDLAAVLAGEPVAAGSHFHAGRQPFDVPLPRAGQRLIEVVDVEDQEALGRAEDPEVRQVGIPARLYRQPRHGGPRQVTGHRQGSTAVERERGDHHPAPPDRHQLRHPRLRLLFQQTDRVGPVRRRVEHRMALPRHRSPCLLTPASTLCRRHMFQPRGQPIPLHTSGRCPRRPHTHRRLLLSASVRVVVIARSSSSSGHDCLPRLLTPSSDTTQMEDPARKSARPGRLSSVKFLAQLDLGSDTRSRTGRPGLDPIPSIASRTANPAVRPVADAIDAARTVALARVAHPLPRPLWSIWPPRVRWLWPNDSGLRSCADEGTRTPNPRLAKANRGALVSVGICGIPCCIRVFSVCRCWLARAVCGPGVPNVSPRRSTCPGLQSLVGPSVNRRPRRKHGAMIAGRRPMIG